MPETSILPSEIHIATHWGTGSLGSETVALECPDPNALKRAVEALSERFRKVYLDGVRGIALLSAGATALTCSPNRGNSRWEGCAEAFIRRGISRKPRTRGRRGSALSGAALTQRWIISRRAIA